jgi:hypothetical protein
MHRAKASARSFMLSEAGDGVPFPPGKNLEHAFCAASNAGPLKLIPSIVNEELPGVAAIVRPSPPEPAVGSGKFGTPWARMHFESCTGVALAADAPAAEVPVPVPVEPAPPQAAIVSAHPRAASPIEHRPVFNILSISPAPRRVCSRVGGVLRGGG